jgi:GTP-binding protein
MADIPGIIEGAAEGKGLGHYFLRHIERNSVLLFLIPADTPVVKKSFDILFKELRTYNPELMDKDFIVVLSKCDLLDEELKSEYAEEMIKNFGEIPHCMISAVDQSGLLHLKDLIWKILNAPHD